MPFKPFEKSGKPADKTKPGDKKAPPFGKGAPKKKAK